MKKNKKYQNIRQQKGSITLYVLISMTFILFTVLGVYFNSNSKMQKQYKEIQKISEIVSTPVGSQYLVFITISVDGNMSTFESHKLADSLELTVDNLDKVYKTVVHVEPV